MIGMVLMLFSLSGQAHNPPAFSIDTKKFTFKINGKEVDKTSIDAILSAIDHGHRVVEKPNKTLYIYDELGFVIEKDSKGIAFKLFYAMGEKENDPKSIFSGSLEINTLKVTANVASPEIIAQLPKTEKTMVMKDMMMYMGDKFIITGESKNDVFKEIDFGFINK